MPVNGGYVFQPNPILTAFIQGTQEREALEQTAKENEFKQQQLDLHHQEIDASTKHLKALTDAAAFQLKERIREGLQTGQIPGGFAQGPSTEQPGIQQQPVTAPPVQLGGKSFPRADATPPQGTPNTPGPPSQTPIGYTDPITGIHLGTGEYQSPEQLIEAQSHARRMLGNVENELAAKKKGAESLAELPTRLLEIEAAHKHAMLVEQMRADSEERIARGRNLTGLQEANIRAAAEKYRVDQEFGTTPDVVSEVGHRVASGQSLADLRKEYSKGDINGFIKANASSGTPLTPLSKDQSDSLKTLGEIAAPGGPLDKMNAFTSSFSSDTQLGATVKSLINKPAAKLSANEAHILALYQEMEAEKVKIGRALMADKNLRAAGLFAEQGKGTMPSLDYTSAENARRVESFKKEIAGNYMNVMKGVPDAEVKRYAAQSNIPLSASTNTKDGKILVVNKSTGQKGYLSPQYFDSNKYEKVAQ